MLVQKIFLFPSKVLRIPPNRQLELFPAYPENKNKHSTTDNPPASQQVYVAAGMDY
jgi:hypothetical protein